MNEALEKSAGQRQPQPPGVRRRPLGGHLPNGLTPNSATADRKEEAYDLARRSLKLWPVSREGELRERTVEFLVNELWLDQQHVTGLNLGLVWFGLYFENAHTIKYTFKNGHYPGELHLMEDVASHRATE